MSDDACWILSGNILAARVAFFGGARAYLESTITPAEDVNHIGLASSPGYAHQRTVTMRKRNMLRADHDAANPDEAIARFTDMVGHFGVHGNLY